MNLSIVVPAFNEAPNAVELIERITRAATGLDAELIVVDDSNDDTPRLLREAATHSPLFTTVIHRATAEGGLAGAVVEGIRRSNSEWCLVMDADLQHPPELIPELLHTAEASGVDVVVGSRHIAGGASAGLGGPVRRIVSNGANRAALMLFPRRLRGVTDPMSGLFVVRRQSLDLTALHPRGFKILLEILISNEVSVTEYPFEFADRGAGTSKASITNGFEFLRQLLRLRGGRVPMFAVIGAIGAVANLLIMTALIHLGVWYLIAATIGGVVTIIGNFVLQELFVFHKNTNRRWSRRSRFLQSFAFNGTETILRTALLWLIVATTSAPSVAVQAALIAIGFTLRFLFAARVVYRPGREQSTAPAEPAELTAV